MPKKGRGKGGTLDPLKLPARLQTALHALYGHYEKTFALWQAAGIDVPPCFIIVCQNTAISKLVYDYISGFHRANEDGPTTLENGRLALFRNFDADTGSPLARPNTLLIDSEQLEAGDALDDDFRRMAADEIERFRREVVERSGDARAGDGLTEQDLLREVMNTVGKSGQLGGGIRCVVLDPAQVDVVFSDGRGAVVDIRDDGRVELLVGNDPTTPTPERPVPVNQLGRLNARLGPVVITITVRVALTAACGSLLENSAFVETRRNVPDFVVLIDDGRGPDDVLHLMVEVKGYRGENAKEKKNTMDSFWVPGVNHLGAYGRWAHVEFTDVFAMQAAFEGVVAEALTPPGPLSRADAQERGEVSRSATE